MRIREKRHPRWMKVPLPAGRSFQNVRKLVQSNHLHTVCQSAHCPNIGECWGNGTATFMILGDRCTRNCRFCNIQSGAPAPVDPDEPKRVAAAVKTLNLNYAVITSVTRDDLPDGGAAHFAETIREIKKLSPDCRVEVLIPDLQGKIEALNIVFDAAPDVLNHNLETVPSLYRQVRPGADFQRSLTVLKLAKENGLLTKSGLMVGLGEELREVLGAMSQLRRVGCDFLTIGQYLQPSAEHLPIARYVTPAEFANLEKQGEEMGFVRVEAGPLVRSSYHAALGFQLSESAEMSYPSPS
ncbi:MAG: lipoyl synthase [Calditrichaeota bacterium]|nr:lipoyl synthase [Calditrichota bacterium]